MQLVSYFFFFPLPLDLRRSQYANMPSVPYELPDGTIEFAAVADRCSIGKVIDVGTERYRIPEFLFDTDSLEDAKDNPGLGMLTHKRYLPIIPYLLAMCSCTLHQSDELRRGLAPRASEQRHRRRRFVAVHWLRRAPSKRAHRG